ncbi:MAG TPA: alginate lyase family protein, partial [Kofleriaceae bacterium]|nr:alginate lyase family protein [Kofleriaceae bacterium]
APPHFDARLTWEINRGHDWVLLARAGRPAALLASLASWRAANPLGIGINWASAMEAAIRIHSLGWVAALTDATIVREHVGAMLHEHSVFVGRNLSRYSSANNHLIVELSALAVASRVLWSRPHARALAELEVEVARQVYADGVNAEMATHYHAFVLEAVLLVTQLERTCGTPRPSLEAIARRMADYLWHLRTASGAYLEQGDSDDGKIIPLLDVDALVAAAHADTLFGGAPPPPPTRSRLFRDSGQVVLRSPRLHVTFDAGPFGYGSLAAHAHCDALAVNVAIDGKPFLVDRGTYRYNGDRAARDRFRMTAAHNTLQVDGREQAQPAGPFLWRTRPTVTLERCDLGDDRDVVVASHDGFGTRHRRTLVREGDVLVIIDECAAPATIRWHLAPDADARALHTVQTATARTTQHSPRYAATVPATTLEVSTGGRTCTAAVGNGDLTGAVRRLGGRP